MDAHLLTFTLKAFVAQLRYGASNPIHSPVNIATSQLQSQVAFAGHRFRVDLGGLLRLVPLQALHIQWIDNVAGRVNLGAETLVEIIRKYPK